MTRYGESQSNTSTTALPVRLPWCRRCVRVPGWRARPWHSRLVVLGGPVANATAVGPVRALVVLLSGDRALCARCWAVPTYDPPGRGVVVMARRSIRIRITEERRDPLDYDLLAQFVLMLAAQRVEAEQATGSAETGQDHHRRDIRVSRQRRRT